MFGVFSLSKYKASHILNHLLLSLLLLNITYAPETTGSFWGKPVRTQISSVLDFTRNRPREGVCDSQPKSESLQQVLHMEPTWKTSPRHRSYENALLPIVIISAAYRMLQMVWGSLTVLSHLIFTQASDGIMTSCGGGNGSSVYESKHKLTFKHVCYMVQPRVLPNVMGFRRTFSWHLSQQREISWMNHIFPTDEEHGQCEPGHSLGLLGGYLYHLPKKACLWWSQKERVI